MQPLEQEELELEELELELEQEQQEQQRRRSAAPSSSRREAAAASARPLPLLFLVLVPLPFLLPAASSCSYRHSAAECPAWQQQQQLCRLASKLLPLEASAAVEASRRSLPLLGLPPLLL